MLKHVIDFLPNIGKNTEVLLFKQFYCFEHYPYRDNSNQIGRFLSDVLADRDITFPFDSSYMFIRFVNHLHTTVKQVGDYTLIINSKIIYPQKMNKIPKLEINLIPSGLNTSQVSGVSSQLANAAENQPQYDGVTIEQMRGNPLYERGDAIDKVGKAQRAMADAAKIVKSRSKYIRALNEHAQKVQKPSSKS